MLYILYFSFMLQLTSWNTQQCTLHLIYQKVDKLVKRHKSSSGYNKTITETGCCYIVEYWPKDTMVIGGGVKAIVCKESCEITNFIRYQ